MVDTVFVLGAGSSQELGLPVGSGLRNTIATMLRIRFDDFGNQPEGDKLISEALRQVERHDPREMQALVHSARQISDAMPLSSSIDSFMETRAGDKRVELCGKLAIVRAILGAERASKLYTDPRRPDLRPNQLELQGTWFNGFWQIFSEGCPRERLEERARAVKFINFNYDRCVERFLYFALQDYYTMGANEAARIVPLVSVYHPYGSIGPLPWSQQRNAVEFGAEINSPGLLEAAAAIKTFSEGTDERSSEITEIREAIVNAGRLVFLGFAFHRQNMKLLWPTARPVAGPEPAQRVFGTALQVSDSDIDLITSELSNLIARHFPIELKSVRCNELFHQFRRSLALV